MTNPAKNLGVAHEKFIMQFASHKTNNNNNNINNN